MDYCERMNRTWRKGMSKKKMAEIVVKLKSDYLSALGIEMNLNEW